MDAANIAVIAILAVLIVLAGWKCLKKRGGSCCGSGGTVKKARVSDRNINNYPYHKAAIVEGMVCLNCVRRVENAFNELEGYYAKVDIDAMRADIYAKKPMDNEFVRGAISKAGYTVRKIDD